MRRTVLLAALSSLLSPLIWAQQAKVHLKVHVVLIDKDLNLKPVPKFSLTLQRPGGDSPGAPVRLKTGLNGIVEADLPAGRYQLSTPEPVEFHGNKFSWKLQVNLTAPVKTIELSNDNALIVSVDTATPEGREDLAPLFERLKSAVVTVRAEGSEGSGFIIDPQGLVLTNAHVVQGSPYLAIQFDTQRKVLAQLVSYDADKDLAVLRVNLSAFPGAAITHLAQATAGKAPVVEGQRVFTIGNPFGREKTLSTGVISKIEAHEIYSDISINPGNSGGPLFDYKGFAVGITEAYRERLARIIPIGDAASLLAEANTMMEGQAPPPAALLPVEPADWFPVEPMKAILQTGIARTNDYSFGKGGFTVWFLTPPLNFWLDHETELKAATRTAQRSGATAFGQVESAELLQEAQRYKPVLTIRATPDYSQNFKFKFKADFSRMRLLCDGKEVPPVHPGRTKLILFNSQKEIADTAFAGTYIYPFDALSTGCGQASLELYSAKNPEQPVVQTLDAALVSRVAADFQPYRTLREQH